MKDLGPKAVIKNSLTKTVFWQLCIKLINSNSYLLQQVWILSIHDIYIQGERVKYTSIHSFFQDISSLAPGGMWLTALMFFGIKQELISTYKQLTAIIFSVFDDFSIYMFVFVITHIFIPTYETLPDTIWVSAYNTSLCVHYLLTF